jgi:hypothetical protein
MNIRKPLSVLAFIAFAAPLSASADAPSGEYYELFAAPSAGIEAKVSDRAEHRNYAEFSYWDMVGDNDPARAVVSREDVKKELASSPLPRIEA